MPGFTGLVRFRLPGLTACLMGLALLGSSSVQGSNGPLEPAQTRVFCGARECPRQASSPGPLSLRGLTSDYLLLVGHPPPRRPQFDPGDLPRWVPRSSVAAEPAPGAVRLAGPGDLGDQVPQPSNHWLDLPIPSNWLTDDAGPSPIQEITGGAAGRSSQGDLSGWPMAPSSPSLFPDPFAPPTQLETLALVPHGQAAIPAGPGVLPVPGPLPALGLATALAYCRQLRRATGRGRR